MLWVSRENRYVPDDDVNSRTAMYKAREDYADDLIEAGAQPFDFFIYYWRDEPEDSLSSRLDGMLAGFKAGDTLILQLPLFIRPLNIKRLIEKIHSNYGGKVIGLVHDYYPLWHPNEAQADTESDPWLDLSSYRTYHELLPLCDGLIVHSQHYKEALQKAVNFQGPIVTQGPFSYHMAPSDQVNTPKFEKKLVFAGNIGKAAYLSDVPTAWRLDVFGSRPNSKLLTRENINYKGSFTPTELPAHLDSGFGLVWDSDRFDQAVGESAEYSRLSYEHKLSLYLVKRMPIFIWKYAAPAKWVTANHLGFAVENLADIWPIIDSFTVDQYQEMQAHLSLVSKLIRHGMFAKHAAFEAVLAVNELANKW
ncbi:glycosyltransferase [Lacticaseibacillus rhamnosus]|uniref:Glycosyltransferase n=1 Tax=Lacticaseibacillus rhamnosus TaxID=47715 RepID=A0AAX0K371_LACRH|nr:sugar transferase [Lacticaseibacillus rhamnosus]ONN75028.1 glycosyltransferase [Lacticaseibacillus rhamnosus]